MLSNKIKHFKDSYLSAKLLDLFDQALELLLVLVIPAHLLSDLSLIEKKTSVLLVRIIHEPKNSLNSSIPPWNNEPGGKRLESHSHNSPKQIIKMEGGAYFWSEVSSAVFSGHDSILHI